jgi:hypothetical protein
MDLSDFMIEYTPNFSDKWELYYGSPDTGGGSLETSSDAEFIDTYFEEALKNFAESILK